MLAEVVDGTIACVGEGGATWPLVTLSVSVADLHDVEKASHSIGSLLAAQKTQQQAVAAGHQQSIGPLWQAPKTAVKKRTLFDFNGFSSPVAGTVHDLSPNKKSCHETPINLEQDDNDGGDEQGFYDCGTCSRAIPASSVLEHLDWHAAVELSENG